MKYLNIVAREGRIVIEEVEKRFHKKYEMPKHLNIENPEDLKKDNEIYGKDLKSTI